MLMKSADVCSQRNCFYCFLHFYHNYLPRWCLQQRKQHICQYIFPVNLNTEALPWFLRLKGSPLNRQQICPLYFPTWAKCAQPWEVDLSFSAASYCPRYPCHGCTLPLLTFTRKVSAPKFIKLLCLSQRSVHDVESSQKLTTWSFWSQLCDSFKSLCNSLSYVGNKNLTWTQIMAKSCLIHPPHMNTLTQVKQSSAICLVRFNW